MAALPNHPLILTDLTEGRRSITWVHPATCTDHTTCEIARRLQNAIRGDWFDLVTDLAPGIYMIGNCGFNGVTFLNDDGQMFEYTENIRPVTRHGLNLHVNGCGICGLPPLDGGGIGHAQQWNTTAGWHQWTQPSQEQISERMLARRADQQYRLRRRLATA